MSILEWIENLDTNQKKILFVYGDIGSGKYYYLKTNLKKYEIRTFNYIDFYSSKDIVKVILNINNFNNLNYMINGNKKPIIIIKEIEFIKSSYIKNILKLLNIKKNKNQKINVPIILIGSGKCIKKIKDLKDSCDIIKFEINKKEIKNYIKKKFKKIPIKNMYIKNNYNQNKINLIYDFLNNNKKNIHNIDILIKNLDYNIELYDNVKELLVKKKNIKDVLKYYHLEKILLPLLIHENYRTFILKNIKKKEDQPKCIKLIANNLMKSDMINEYIFNNHVWNIQDLFAILNCQYTSYIINTKFENKSKITIPKLNYTKILTKNSMIFSNFNQYKILLHKIKYIHNFDQILIEYLNKNLLIFLLNNTYYGLEYLNKLNLDNKDLLKIIKFSKIYHISEDNLKNKSIILKKLKGLKK
jgi:hypothetical protein